MTAARPAVEPGRTQVIALRTAPNAQVSVTVHFPDGSTDTETAVAGSDGKARVTVKVPITAYDPAGDTAAVTAASTSGGLTRTGLTSFRIRLPKLAVLLDPASVHLGEQEMVTALGHPGTRIQIRVAFPAGTPLVHRARANGHGLVIYRFTVSQNELRGGNHTVVVTARLLTGARVSVRKNLHVQTG
jgi:hypothetical protein